MPPLDSPPGLAIFLHSGDYDRVHQGLAIAASAAAAGRTVDVFLFWWALERVLQGKLDEPDFGPEREATVHRFEARRLPTLRELFLHLRELGGCRVHACSGSLAAVADEPGNLGPLVNDVVGWSTILKLTAGITDRFYL